MTTDPIAAALDHIRSVTNRAWCAEDFEGSPGNPVDSSIATILNAVVAGQLILAPPVIGWRGPPEPAVCGGGGPANPIAAARALLEELERPSLILALGYLQVTRELKATVATLADALEAERAEVERLTKGSICEVAATNQSVMEYMRHWERRAEKAETERDQAIARLAAVHREVIERCAALLIELGYVSESGETLANEVRGLRVDPDAQAALDKLLAEARMEGWRAGRDAAADEAQSCTHEPYVVRAIRALPEPKGSSHG